MKHHFFSDIKWVFIILLSFTALCLSGCINLGPGNATPTSNYALSAPDDLDKIIPKAKKQRPITMLVSKGYAMPGYNTANLMYQRGNNAPIQAYAYHRWVAPPSNMIAPVITQALNDSHAFKAVINAPFFNGRVDYRINVQLVKLIQKVTDGEGQVTFVLNIMLINESNGKLMTAKQFATTVPTAANPESAVQASNQALAKLLPAITQFIVKGVP